MKPQYTQTIDEEIAQNRLAAAAPALLAALQDMVLLVDGSGELASEEPGNPRVEAICQQARAAIAKAQS